MYALFNIDRYYPFFVSMVNSNLAKYEFPKNKD